MNDIAVVWRPSRASYALSFTYSSGCASIARLTASSTFAGSVTSNIGSPNISQ